MNGRKAKALRAMAGRLTQGLPTHGLVSDGPMRTRPFHDGTNPDGKPRMRWLATTGTLRHKPTTVRAVYQKLKRTYRHAHLGALK